jgi:hypothetical protein
LKKRQGLVLVVPKTIAIQQLPLMKTLLLSLSAFLIAPSCFAQQSYDPATEAQKLFEAYRPTVERSEQGIVDGPSAITGDLNGDGLTDCILYFVLTPQGGGNAIIGRKAAVYLNTGRGMKVDGAFPDLKYCFGIDKIAGGVIYVDSYACEPPYNTRKGSYRYHWIAKKLAAVK